MSGILLASSGVVVVGGMLCVVGREARTIAAGLFLALAAAALLADPAPDPLPAAARITAAAIVAELSWIALRDRPEVVRESRPGWLAQSLLMTASVAIALGLHDANASLGAPDLARSAGLSLLVAAAPGLFGGSPARTAIAILLLVAAALLLQAALPIESAPFVHLVASLVELAAAGAVLIVLQLSSSSPPRSLRAAPPSRGGPGSSRRGPRMTPSAIPDAVRPLAANPPQR